MNRSHTCIATLNCQVEYQLSSSLWEGGVVWEHRHVLACCASGCCLCTCPELVPFGCIWGLQKAAACGILFGSDEGQHRSDTQTQSEDRQTTKSYAKDTHEMQRAIENCRSASAQETVSWACQMQSNLKGERPRQHRQLFLASTL